MNRRIRWIPASTFFDHNNVKKIESIKHVCNAFTHVAQPQYLPIPLSLPLHTHVQQHLPIPLSLPYHTHVELQRRTTTKKKPSRPAAASYNHKEETIVIATKDVTTVVCRIDTEKKTYRLRWERNNSG